MYSQSFKAEVDKGCQILILGSMPGIKSLDEQQYYAHPRNAFWPIMQSLFSIDLNAIYEQRLQQMKSRGLGLWDVYAECERPGSLDSSINVQSIRFNPIVELLTDYPSIHTLACNGGAAHKAVLKYLKQQVFDISNIQILALPSTSPAYAAMRFEQKLERWQLLKDTVK